MSSLTHPHLKNITISNKKNSQLQGVISMEGKGQKDFVCLFGGQSRWSINLQLHQ